MILGSKFKLRLPQTQSIGRAPESPMFSSVRAETPRCDCATWSHKGWWCGWRCRARALPLYVFDFRAERKGNPFVWEGEGIARDYKFHYVLIDINVWGPDDIDVELFSGPIYVYRNDRPLAATKKAENFRRLVKHSVYGWILTFLPGTYCIEAADGLAAKHDGDQASDKFSDATGAMYEACYAEKEFHAKLAYGPEVIQRRLERWRNLGIMLALLALKGCDTMESEA